MKFDEIRLSDLLARTRVEDDCLVWTGFAQNGKYPMWTVDYKPRPVRRMIWEIIHERSAGPWQVNCNCETDLCVHPNHLRNRSRSIVMKTVGGLSAIHLLHVEQGRRKGALIDMDDARAIRASEETLHVIADRFGITASHASKIRCGKAWRDTASPFSGLGATT